MTKLSRMQREFPHTQHSHSCAASPTINTPHWSGAPAAVSEPAHVLTPSTPGLQRGPLLTLHILWVWAEVVVASWCSRMVQNSFTALKFLCSACPSLLPS